MTPCSRSRPGEHGDLDLVVEDIAIGRLTSLLVDEGFEVVRDWLPTSIAFRHPDGRELDLHPVELTEDGGGDQVQLDGERRWHYAPPTMGRIGGRLVACCTVETEIASHLGYEPDENDFRDMRALAERFGCVLSPGRASQEPLRPPGGRHDPRRRGAGSPGGGHVVEP